MRRVFILVSLLVSFAVSLPAMAARGLQLKVETKRYALVIGNDHYHSLTHLEKAANDAKAMGASLTRIGFQTRVLLDANRRQMNSAINHFVENIAGGGEGVLFFAGHGVQINNQNFLLPVDIDNPRNEIDVADQALSLQTLQDKIAQVHAKFTLLIVDACRDNPLPKKAGRSLGGTRGMAQASSAEGQMVIFSAGANQQALDKLHAEDTNPNGVFTREFLPWLSKPGVNVRQVALEVRRAVYAKAKSVNHSQFPAVYDQVLGDFYFVPGAKEPVPINPAPAQAIPAIPAIPAKAATQTSATPTMPKQVTPDPEQKAVNPIRPTIAVAGLVLPSSHSFWGRETSDSYAPRVNAALQQGASEVLNMKVHRLELKQTEFKAWWHEAEHRPHSQALCAASPAPDALLSAYAGTPSGYSTVESAFWPELKLRLFICKNQRTFHQHKTLAPQNSDKWPFSTELTSEIERFVRIDR